MEQEPIVQRYTLYIVLAVLFLTIGLPRVVGGQPGTFKDAVDLSGGLITIGTLLTPKKKPGDLPATRRQDFRLAPSFMSGWYGGIVGGAVAGLIVGVAYYSTVRNVTNWWELIPLIFGYAVMTGLCFGATTLFGAQLASYLAAESVAPVFIANEVVGGLLGGAFGGMLAGAYGGWIFGYRPTPLVNLVLLSFAGTVGAFAVCGGVLLYDYPGRLSDLARVFFFSLVPTLGAAMIGFYVLLEKDIGGRYFGEFDSRLANLQGGAYMGAVVGATLGIQVGFTLLFYRLSNKPATMQPARG